jgi:hypothetical protein
MWCIHTKQNHKKDEKDINTLISSNPQNILLHEKARGKGIQYATFIIRKKRRICSYIPKCA